VVVFTFCIRSRYGRVSRDMPSFFREAARRLAYLNPEPDRWKDRAERPLDPALDGGTSPDHFVDSDLVTPSQVKGFLPFAILDCTSKLRGDFRLWRRAPDATVRA